MFWIIFCLRWGITLNFKYKCRPGDQKYRLVSLVLDTAGDWTSFADCDEVEYAETCVLEIEREGEAKPVIEYERQTRTFYVGKDHNMLYLPLEIPTARLWVRGANGMAYKVPEVLREQDGNRYLLIPGGTHNVTIFGDEYFSKAYAAEMG